MYVRLCMYVCVWVITYVKYCHIATLSYWTSPTLYMGWSYPLQEAPELSLHHAHSSLPHPQLCPMTQRGMFLFLLFYSLYAEQRLRGVLSLHILFVHYLLHAAAVTVTGVTVTVCCMFYILLSPPFTHCAQIYVLNTALTHLAMLIILLYFRQRLPIQMNSSNILFNINGSLFVLWSTCFTSYWNSILINV